MVTCQVTCDLIPLAVLKHEEDVHDGLCSAVTCDLIPLAVLKLERVREGKVRVLLSHVTSYRLRY